MTEEDDDHSTPAKGYLKYFSLQAGSVITSTIGASLMLSVSIYNCFPINRYATFQQQLIQYFLIYVYSILMLVGCGMISFASFLAAEKTYKIGYYLNLFGYLYWIGLCIIAYVPAKDIFRYVCIDNRCPEVHWFYDTRWRNYGFPCPFGDMDADEIDNFTSTSLRSYYIGCENYDEMAMATSTILGILWGVFMGYGLHTYKQFMKELFREPEHE